MRKRISSTVIIALSLTTNLFSQTSGVPCTGDNCRASIIQAPVKISPQKDELKIDDSYRLEVAMEIEKSKADGKTRVVVESGYDSNGEYYETESYDNVIPNYPEIKLALKQDCKDQEKVLACIEQIKKDECRCA